MKEFLNNQYKNLFLWSPFVAAFGAALYFSLNIEPKFMFPFLITALCIAVIYKSENIFIRSIVLFLFGFFYAMSYTHTVNTPQIRDSFDEIELSGKIKDIDFTSESTQIILRTPLSQINEKFPDTRYANIRISLKDNKDFLHIGDTISGKAMIFHPSAKYAPESFDFARWAYFNKISGTGFFTEYKIIPSTKSDNNFRTHIHNKTKSKLTDALVLGYKKSLKDTERKIWQSIGMGHIWSISGFHLTLVGGWLFALFYFIFRLIAPISKRVPAKYPAMICAWFGLILYLCISGISVATIRAFCMTTLIFVATIFARGILSLRNAALVFWLLFLLNPFYVMQAGFQLSFAAIFGLLWFFSDTKYIKRSWIGHLWHIIYITLITTFIATIFTLPFVIAHFGFVPIYSLISNIILLPIFSFLIMPLVMIGVVFALFGNMFFLNITDKIYSFAFHIANYISGLPGANITVPHISNTALILCITGMLCIIFIVKNNSEKIFMKNINYFVGGTFIFAALIIFSFSPRPLFYASDEHNLVGFVVDNEIQFNKARSSKHFFAFNTWRQFNNEPPKDTNKKYKCKSGLCVYETANWKLVYMQKFTTILNNFDDVCMDKSVDYMVTPFDMSGENCHAKILNDGILIYPSGHVKYFSNQRLWNIMP